MYAYMIMSVLSVSAFLCLSQSVSIGHSRVTVYQQSAFCLSLCLLVSVSRCHDEFQCVSDFLSPSQSVPVCFSLSQKRPFHSVLIRLSPVSVCFRLSQSQPI